MHYSECPLGCTSEAQHEAHTPKLEFPPSQPTEPATPISDELERRLRQLPQPRENTGAASAVILARDALTALRQVEKDAARWRYVMDESFSLESWYDEEAVMHGVLKHVECADSRSEFEATIDAALLASPRAGEGNDRG